jgi:streptolysin S family bacteriocin protoxin
MNMRAESRAENRWSSANVVVAPGGWCSCCSSWCWCHVSGMVSESSTSEEL